MERFFNFFSPVYVFLNNEKLCPDLKISLTRATFCFRLTVKSHILKFLVSEHWNIQLIVRYLY